MRIELRHIHRFKDRHGTVRHYLRIPGKKAIPLPGPPGSPGFMAAYNSAVAAAGAPEPPQPGKVIPRSFDALAVSFYASSAWQALREPTQRNYRRIIEEMRAKHGAKPVARIDALAIRTLMGEKAGRPTAANRRLILLRLMLRHAIDLAWISSDPTRDVARHAYRTDGYATWSEDEIAAYRARHASGTVARLAFELLLNTGQRRSDVVRMGPQHVRAGTIHAKQVKTGNPVDIPIIPDLAAELALIRHRHLTWLALADGASRSPNGFYNSFRAWCVEAGIPPARSPHGLRKACGVRLAEAGCSPHQIMAILGHRTLKEAQRYTETADRRRMARSGMDKLVAFTQRNAG